MHIFSTLLHRVKFQDVNIFYDVQVMALYKYNFIHGFFLFTRKKLYVSFLYLSRMTKNKKL